MRTAQFTGAKEVARTEKGAGEEKETNERGRERKTANRENVERERERERGEKLGGAVERGSSCDVE